MKKTHRLLILSRDAGRYTELIKGLALPGLEVETCYNQQEAIRSVGESDILLGEPRPIL